jgi:tetratricopeptide (TPR) repeat protein
MNPERLKLKAMCLDLHGDVMIKKVNYEAAKQSYTELGKVADELGELGSWFTARSLLGIGRVDSGHCEFENAEIILRQSITEFEKLGDDNGVIESRRNLANVLWRMGKFEEGVEILKTGREIADGIQDPALVASMDSSLGNIYRDMGEWEASVEHFEKAIEFLENETGNKFELTTAYNNIGATYRYLENWTKAIDYFDRCIELGRSIRATVMIGYGLKNKAECSAKRGGAGDLETAEKCVEEAIKIFEETNHEPGIVNCHMIRGIISKFKGDFSDIDEHFKIAIEEGKKIQIPDLLADIYYEYALAFLAVGNDKKAVEELEKAIDLFDQVGAGRRTTRARDLLRGIRSDDGGGENR